VAGVDDVHGALTNLSLCKSKVRVRAHTHTHTHTHAEPGRAPLGTMHCSPRRIPTHHATPPHNPQLRLPDLPYFTGDPVFQPRSPACRKEAARETESPVGYLTNVTRIYTMPHGVMNTNHLCSEHSIKIRLFLPKYSTLFGPRCLII